jgi:hypothetical protein
VGSRYFISLSSFPHLNPTAFLSSTGVWNLERPFPLSSSRPFSWFLSSIQSVIVLSSSSSPSYSFPKSFRCVAELQVSHFVIVLLSSCASTVASTVASSVRHRLRSRISDISSWSTFTCSRAISALRLSISSLRARFLSFESHKLKLSTRQRKAHPLRSSVYLEFSDSYQQVLQSQLSCFATLISHIARLFSATSVQLRFQFLLSELFYNV